MKPVCSVEGCGIESRTKGYCNKHYQRVLKHGDVNAGVGLRAPVEDRFWRFVDRRGTNECWPWVGSKDRLGYGHLKSAESSAGIEMAHRVSYRIHCGLLPNYSKDAVVMHSCDNPSCVNPLHLSIGTQWMNTMEMVVKGRQPYCGLKGEKHSQAKLTEDAVREIRASGESHAALARKYGVDPMAIKYVRIRKTWQHIE